MKSCRVAQMQLALTTKGFAQEQSHHEMYWLYAYGKKTSIRTRISHGEREYNQGLLAQVRKQIKLKNWDEFERFMECPMNGTTYLALMVDRGHVKKPPAAAPTAAAQTTKKQQKKKR